MARLGKFKLADALGPPRPASGFPKGGKPKRVHETTAEQTREAKENDGANAAGGSTRDRMVDIGRGNQQAGRRGS
jgi:hypothetical protein